MKRVCDVLLIDDDVQQLYLLEQLQQELGLAHRYCHAEDGQAALKILRRQAPHADARRPNLILLDLTMPGLSGYEVLKAIKGDPELRSIPVIVLSASKDKADIMDCYREHANAYIAKPDTLDDNFRVVKAIENFWIRTAVLLG